MRTETTTTKMVLRMLRMQCRHAGPDARGEGQEPRIPRPPPRDPAAPPGGGSVLVIEGRRGWGGGLPSANDNNKNDYD